MDCSHMNSGKQFQNQIPVWIECVKKRMEGLAICGLMAESNIDEGRQEISEEPLRYGVSVTDECLGWDTTERLIKRNI